jgi:hypothetical protein
VYKISRSWVDLLIFTFFYLESSLWPDTISVTADKKQQHINVCEELVTLVTLSKLTILPVEYSKLTETEKGEACEDKIQEHVHHFL